MSMAAGIEQYKEIDVSSSICEADPHRLVQLLMQGLLDRLATAKGHMIRKDLSQKSNYIQKAFDIVLGLKGSLNIEADSTLGNDLDHLYSYMLRRLLKASKDNNPEILDEISSLMSNIKSAWDAIPQEARQQYADSQKIK